MKIAIVVPYLAEEDPAHLAKALESVAKQTVQASAVAMCDDARINGPHFDWGNFARCVGALQAVHEGCDAIGFLDSDNWLEADHVERMLALDVPVAIATRTMCRVDGSTLFVDAGERDENGQPAPDAHVDTSCLFLRREAFGLLPIWGLIPRALAGIGDRIFFEAVKRYSWGISRRRCPVPTVNYRTRYAVHYQQCGELPPPGAKSVVHPEPGTYHFGLPYGFAVSVVAPSPPAPSLGAST